MEEGKWVTEDIDHTLISEFFTVEEKWLLLGVSMVKGAMPT